MKCPKCNKETEEVTKNFHVRHTKIYTAENIVGNVVDNYNWTDFYWCSTCQKGIKLHCNARMKEWSE